MINYIKIIMNQLITDINKEFLLGIKKFYKKHELVASPMIKIKFWIKYWRIYYKIFFKI